MVCYLQGNTLVLLGNAIRPMLFVFREWITGRMGFIHKAIEKRKIQR